MRIDYFDKIHYTIVKKKSKELNVYNKFKRYNDFLNIILTILMKQYLDK